MKIKQTLQEIAELLRDELPELGHSLNPPASEDELHKAEEELGFSLPTELWELYLTHNGEKEDGPGLFFGLPFLPLDGMMAEWRIWADLEEQMEGLESEHYSVPAGWIKEQYINRGWLPISKDWGGNNLGVDIDPDREGTAGQIINFGRDEEIKYVIARNLSHWLQFIHDTAKAGNYTVHEEDEYRHWTLGRDSGTHLFDTIRSQELPVLEPVHSKTSETDAAEWMSGLDSEWQTRVANNGGTPEKFFGAKRLMFIREGLTDISPLGRCKEVRELVLSRNEISSIAPLSGCTQLKTLYLGGNPVTDLRPLQGLAHLKELILLESAVADLSPLSAMTGLQSLDVQLTPVRDYSPLRQLASLRALKVSDPDAEQVRELAELRQLKELTITRLGAGAESELEALGQLSKLEALHLDEVSLKSLDFLRNCRKLRKVTIADSSVQDASALGELPNLHSLELQGGPEIGGLEKVAKSASLKRASVSFPQFALLTKHSERYIDFSTMNGKMTDEESSIWHRYLDSARESSR
ncbi:SMI1/KNR4 family protein [Cohnella sp. LGH]|uniref:SMI1/KNR4 family protein n=1 Tax=Cohnella sp. LGH TaxID=1619153 RepID=UPI001ADD15B6|nr:SMI1/KNR4 family protein [Cohnella sp. LGH]QTH40946.1 SMI1/KNR4 family protein [Cohnella sp. LGH]